MKRIVVCGLLAVLLASVGAVTSDAEKPAAKNPNLGKLRHVVILRFKQDTSKEQIQALEKAFCQLPSKIDTIVDFEWGTNVSEEGFDQGFTHCYLVTFDDVKGRGVYLPHPAHKDFVKILLPHLDKALVVDYVAK
jgi:hypothetical protein